MMSNRNTDILFQLVRSLEKAEKRHFKLYIKRSSGNNDLKIIRLFDVLDKLPEYDETMLVKKMPGVTKSQLNNLKQHLYKQLLASLRLLKTNDTTDLQLSELLDNARLLYHKGLKLQALKFLNKAKDLARQNHKFNYLAQVISLEKKIETLHITRSSLETAEQLSKEASDISWHIDSVVKLSNLALLLYSWYIKHGHARNEQDESKVNEFFKSQLPAHPERITDFYEQLYLYQSYCWYAFIRQDFLMYYRYSQKWIDLYQKEPLMISVETGHYIKGLHTLLNAHFVLRNFKKFEITLEKFESFSKTAIASQHDNFHTHTFIYISAARINQHLMQGTFSEGLKLIAGIEKKLQEYSLFVDKHRLLVFNYKIAMLYFGSGNYSRAVDYLQKIIHGSDELRMDLQCYARLLHLLSHYELGNDEIIESLSKSTYRFMAKMKNLTVVEEEMFRFLRKAFELNQQDVKPELEKFLYDIKHLETNRFETRSFAYLDIISWLESKVFNKSMSNIIYNKHLNSRHK